MPIPSDIKQFGKNLSDNLGLHWPTIDKQFTQESNWEHLDSQGNIKTSSGGAKGVTQIVPSSHPNANWADPYDNTTYGINLMASHLKKFGSYKKALAAYNWGPGNVAGYTKDGLTHPAWDGTRDWRCPHEGKVRYCSVGQMHHYLDVILGPEWKEPVSVTSPDPYSVGPGLRALMQQHNDSPASDELYYKNPQGQDQWSEAMGVSGSIYRYVHSLNQNFRFPAD